MASKLRFIMPAGSNVDLSVTQGGVTANGAEPNWGGGGGGGPFVSAIIASATTGFGPLGVMLTTDATSAQKASLRFLWGFGGSGNYGLLLPNRLQGSNRNEAYGHTVAHTFAPGIHTVVCAVTDGVGPPQILSQIITVVDPDVQFPGTNTMVVDPSGNYSGKPASAQEFTTIEAARTALQTNGGGRLLMRRGNTYTPTGDFSISGSSLAGQTAINRVLIGAFGAGDKPVFDNDTYRIRVRNMDNDASQIAFQGLDVRGSYDVTTGTGDNAQGGIDVWSLRGTHTIDQCDFSGNQTAIVTTFQNSPDRRLIVSDCSITGWENYGIFSTDGELAVFGCSIRQAGDTVNGLGAKDLDRSSGLNWADHGPIRNAWGKKLYIAKNDLFSRNGWSGAYGKTAHQPCLRVNQSSDTDVECNIQENTCEGGWVTVSFDSQDSGTPMPPYAVCTFEKNHLIGTAGTENFVRVLSGGLYIRNNILAMPNVPNELNPGFVEFLDSSLSSKPQINGNEAAPRVVVNNTFIDLRSPANQPNDSVVYDPAQWASNGWSNYEIANNVVHAPNRTVPDTTYAPLSAIGSWAALYDGELWNGTPLDASYDSSGVGSTGGYQQQIGSSAIDGASTGTTALDDFLGGIRDGTPSIGAWDTV